MAVSMLSPEGNLPSVSTVNEITAGVLAERAACAIPIADEAQDPDAGDPHELAAHYRALVDRVPTLNVLGGCCGPDHRHIEELCKATIRSCLHCSVPAISGKPVAVSVHRGYP
jgi:methionine synthase I (cobalamin-dependent)